MNQITTRQNEQKQIERLAAQREVYSKAKQWQIWQLVISIIVSVGLGVWSLIDPTKADIAALYGFMVAILDTFVFDHFIGAKRTIAAKIQEQFDCYVLEFDCSPLKSPDDVTEEDVYRYYGIHNKTPGNIEKLIGWYPISVAELPLHLGRLVCQRSNCSWDSELRRRYANVATVILVITFGVLLILGLSLGYELKEFLLLLGAFAPFLVYCGKQIKDQRDASERQKNLVKHAQSIWTNDFFKGDQTLTGYSRQLQNDIYDARSSNPAILDIFYERLKVEQENTMNRTAEALTADAFKRLASHSNRPL